jgi:hypothetical protein
MTTKARRILINPPERSPSTRFLRLCQNLVFAMLAPLYELFDFFRLPKRLVEEELASLLRNRF